MARKTFDHLWSEIVAETKAEGRDAQEQLEDFSSAFAWARKLAFARRGRSLSQGQVAKLTGITQSEISRIESGAANPTIQTVQRLGAAYDLSLDFVARKKPTKAAKSMAYVGVRHGSRGAKQRRPAMDAKKAAGKMRTRRS